MRIVVFAFLITIANVCNAFSASYNADVASCDELYETQSKNANNTISIIQSLTEHTDCYQKIVFSIIDSKYKHDADKMKQNFITYINTAGEMIDFIDRPDSCYPQCGTIVGISAATARRDAVKQYLDRMLGINTGI